MTYEELSQMADNAMPVTADDWGSGRQVACQNAFFDAVREILQPEEYEALENFCLSATTEESLDRAMMLVAPHYPP